MSFSNLLFLLHFPIFVHHIFQHQLPPFSVTVLLAVLKPEWLEPEWFETNWLLHVVSVPVVGL